MRTVHNKALILVPVLVTAVALLWVLTVSRSSPGIHPPEGVASEWYAITIGKAVIGREERRRDGPRVWRHREYLLEVGRTSVQFSVTSEALLDEGRLVRWERHDDGGLQRAWMTGGNIQLEVGGAREGWPSEAPFLPDYMEDPATLEGARGWVLQAGGQRPVLAVTEFVREGGGIRWVVDGVVYEADSRGARSGLVAITRTETRPELPGTTDLQALLRVPLPGPVPLRAAREVTLRVNGELQVYTRPLDAEIPREERLRVATWGQEVRDRLTVTPTPSDIGGLAALQKRQGDCNEHAEALVHLAREAGLEAEVVHGVAYDEGAAGPGFYPHAWARVRLADGHWLHTDPILGQTAADPSHLALGTGLLSASMLQRVSELQVEVVNWR